MRLTTAMSSRGLLVLLAATLSCTADRVVAPVEASITGPAGSPDIVISEVYGGGGNSGAPLRNDFVELFNRGGTTVSLAGWSVQYTSATGTGNFSANATALPAASLAPGQYFLVQMGGGSNGSPLPTPDATGSTNMSATGGKVLVANTSAGIACNGGSTPCSASQLAQIVDLVGYDGANFFEGSATAPTLSNTTANFRKDGGCQDSNDNSADFTAGPPAPRTTATPVQPCPGVFPLGALDHVLLGGPTTVTAGFTVQLTAKPQDEHNQTIPTATVTWSSADETIATVDQTGLVTGVAANANTVGITATATDDGITRSATLQVLVSTPEIHWIDVSSSSTSLPAGFQTQLFATARVAQNGLIIPATFVFEAVDPQLATIANVQNTGLVTAVMAPANGSDRPGFRIIATPTAGGAGGGGTPDTFITHSIFVETPHPAPLDIYATNDEFGDPTPATTATPNDLLIVRPQYTLSYNTSHGTPNWVSYELDTRQIVAGQDRCNCFTADPVLPADRQIFTSDYTGSGFDRGHMTRSFDRTAGNTDNAATFYLTNIVPQTADLNQGVWAQFENALGDSARLGGRAVYIITGPWYDPAQPLRFVKNEGKVAIPDRTWKVALIGPYPKGSLATWDDLAGVTVLAVSMPNIAGVRNDPWQNYLTTVDALESATGYDVLSLLPLAFQSVVEGGEHLPVANAGGPYEVLRNSAITLSGAASTAPTGDVLQYAWDFGDGTAGSGVAPAHTYTESGSFDVRLTVSDAYGANSTSTAVVTVLSTLQGIAALNDALTDFARAAGLNGGQVTSLRAKLNAALSQCRRDSVSCANILNAFIEELKHYDSDQVAAITQYAERVIASVSAVN